MESTLPQTAATALINISLAWIAGVLASRMWLMHGTAPWQVSARKRLMPAMAGNLLTCTAGIFLSLWTESAAMGDVAWLDAWPACAEMLTSTHYGHAGVAAMVILLLALLMHWRLQGKEVQYITTITVLMLLVAIARVVIGHAYEHGPFSAAVGVEWLHIVLMSLWAGTVFVAGLVVLPQLLRVDSFGTAERGRYLRSMSDWATVALAGILATGAYNSYRVLGSPTDLLQTDYGNVLVFKLGLVIVAIVLGGFNKLFGLPAALSQRHATQAQRGLRTVVRILRIESVALFLVLVAAAMLTSSAPPGQL